MGDVARAFVPTKSVSSTEEHKTLTLDMIVRFNHALPLVCDSSKKTGHGISERRYGLVTGYGSRYERIRPLLDGLCGKTTHY